jgi:hypothetical protein
MKDLIIHGNTGLWTECSRLFVGGILLLTMLSAPRISFAQTELCGSTTQDLHLTAADSPFRLCGDLRINASASLTMDSGVSISSEWSGYNIHINDFGTLIATGVTFDGASDSGFAVYGQENATLNVDTSVFTNVNVGLEDQVTTTITNSTFDLAMPLSIEVETPRATITGNSFISSAFMGLSGNVGAGTIVVRNYQGVPYRLTQDIQVENSATLIFGEGITLQSASSNYDVYLSEYATVSASQVMFDGSSDSGFTIYADDDTVLSLDSSEFTNVAVSIRDRSSLSLTNNVFDVSRPLSIELTNPSPTVSGNSFRANASVGLSGNLSSGSAVLEGIQGLPYLATSQLDVYNSASLTLGSGVTLTSLYGGTAVSIHDFGLFTANGIDFDGSLASGFAILARDNATFDIESSEFINTEVRVEDMATANLTGNSFDLIAPISMEITAIQNSVSGNSFPSNALIKLFGTSSSGTTKLQSFQDLPFRLYGDLRIENSANLVISPGVNLSSASSSYDILISDYASFSANGVTFDGASDFGYSITTHGNATLSIQDCDLLRVGVNLYDTVEATLVNNELSLVYPIYMEITIPRAHLEGNTFVSNAYIGISGDVSNGANTLESYQGLPFRLAGHVDVANTASLEIASGVEIASRSSYQFLVDDYASLIATGVVFDGASGSRYTILLRESASIRIENSSLLDVRISIDDNADVGISNSNIYHSNRAITNSGALSVQAQDNYWGSPSGPSHISNPAGTGAQVSDNVSFVPWLNAPAIVPSDGDGSETGEPTTIAGTITNIALGITGSLVESYLPNASVQLFSGNELVATVFSGEQGAFTIENLENGGSYILKVTASEYEPALNRYIQVEYERTLNAGSVTTHSVPLALAVEKARITNQLANLTIQADLFLGLSTPVGLLRNYDTSQTEALLASWASNLGTSPEAISESMARLIVAETVMHELYGNAATMTHEMVESLYAMIKGFFTTKQVIDSISEAVTASGTVPGFVSEGLVNVISNLSSQIFLEYPRRVAASLMPDPYGKMVYEATDAMQQAVYAKSLSRENGLGYEFIGALAQDFVTNAILTAGDYAFLQVVYVPRTERFLDRSVNGASTLLTSGTTQEAYAAVLGSESSILAASDEATASIRAQSNNLQLSANIGSKVGTIAGFASVVPGFQVLKGVGIALKGLSIAGYGTAAGKSGFRLAGIASEVDLGMLRAFDPSAAGKSMLAPLSRYAMSEKYDSEQLMRYNSRLASVNDAFILLLEQIVFHIQNGERQQALDKTSQLIALEGELTSAEAIALAPVVAAAEEAIQTNAQFEVDYGKATDAAVASAANRMLLYSQLFEYAENSSTDTTELASQVDSVEVAIGQVASAISTTSSTVSGVSVPPIVIVKSMSASVPSAEYNEPFEIRATILNAGTLNATDISATISVDTVATLLSSPSLTVSSLAVDQEMEIIWDVQVVDTSRTVGGYVVTVEIPGGRSYSSSGQYQVAKRLTSVGVGSDAKLPSDVVLKQNYPNPFAKSTSIIFDIPSRQHVRLTVYDILGREIDVLEDGVKNAGRHIARWSADTVNSGVYVYQLITQDGIESKVLTVLK